jgi:hypothetical protein
MEHEKVKKNGTELSDVLVQNSSLQFQFPFTRTRFIQALAPKLPTTPSASTFGTARTNSWVQIVGTCR